MSAPPESLVFFTDRDLGKRFPDILSEAGLSVKRHTDLFPPDCPDDVWLQAVGEQQWIAVSHDARIRYKPNELAAVINHNVRLLVVMGKAPYPDLAKNFVATILKTFTFIASHPAPWIAKIYRPFKSGAAKRLQSTGDVVLWYPPTGPKHSPAAHGR